MAVRSRPDGTGPAGRDSAFVLPLALSVSLLVLLGSLSVQTAAIRNRLSQVGREEQRRQEDALVSLAHSVVGEFNRSSPCLLTVPLASWSLIAGGCAGLQQQEDLKRGVWDGLGWRLLAWQPQTESAELVLEMESNSRDGGVRRAAFAVPLRGDPPRAIATRLLGLRGVMP